MLKVEEKKRKEKSVRRRRCVCKVRNVQEEVKCLWKVRNVFL